MKIIGIGNLGSRKMAREKALIRAQKIAEEYRLQEMVKRVAQKVYIPQRVIFTKNSENVANFSATKTIQTYSSKMDMNNSVWAPWSINFK